MSGPVKVLVVIGQLEVGGTETHLLNVLPAINKPPLEIVVYALRGGGRLESAFTGAGVRVVSPAHHSRRWIGLARTSVHLLATWRSERPAVVHFFLPEAYLLGGLCSFLAPSCRRVMSRRSLNDYQKKWPGCRSIERGLHRAMDAVLANSRAVERQLAEEGVPPSRRALLPNGVEIPAVGGEDPGALRERLAIPPGAIVFVLVANLIPYKGHADAVDAFARAAERLTPDWAVLFVGEDHGLRDGLEAAAERAGIADHVHWLGRLDDVRPVLEAADVGLNTSHEEGFSNAVLEAMAAGLPVIATAVGGNTDAVADGETGLLVAPGAPAALADAIVRLAREPATRAAMGDAGRERVEGRFSMARCRAAYERLYTGIASDNPPPPATLIDQTGAQ